MTRKSERLRCIVNQPEPSTSVGKEVIVMNKLVRLWKRPSLDAGRVFWMEIRDMAGTEGLYTATW